MTFKTKKEYINVMKVKIFITVNVDEEEYHIPADGDVGSELEDSIKDHLYDVGGIRIINIKSITENNYD